MRDATSFAKAQLLHPKIRQDVIDIINDIEADKLPPNTCVKIVQGLRTIQEQNALYAQGRTMPGNRVTNAKGGSSFHNFGLAFDFCLAHDKDGNGTFEDVSWDIKLDYDHDGEPDWMEVVNEFVKHGFEWGGNFHSIKDYPHLQKIFGYKWQDLLLKYNKKDFINGTTYINI